jgi:hypothetical protein
MCGCPSLGRCTRILPRYSVGSIWEPEVRVLDAGAEFSIEAMHFRLYHPLFHFV